MSIEIEPVNTSKQLDFCHQIQIDIFHHELKLFGMQIPDRYDRFSTYMQISNSDIVVGTYRIIFPNPSTGFPIEESGFDLNQIHHNNICEMSRLALLKEKRGKIPFSQIVSSACKVAKYHNASILIAAILPQNVPLFQRYGFSKIGEPLYDPSVKINNPQKSVQESIVVPMQIPV